MGSVTGSMTQCLLEDLCSPQIDPCNADHYGIIKRFHAVKIGPAVESTFIANLLPSQLPQSRGFPVLMKNARDSESEGFGWWKVKVGSFSAVTNGLRGYVGAKRTLEFRPHGTTTDWLMTQYFVLNPMEQLSLGYWIEVILKCMTIELFYSLRPKLFCLTFIIDTILVIHTYVSRQLIWGQREYMLLCPGSSNSLTYLGLYLG
jgi:hypothetical protein